MMITAFILRPWLMMIEDIGRDECCKGTCWNTVTAGKPADADAVGKPTAGIHGRILADDMMIMAEGPGHLARLVKAVDKTHDMLHDMGAATAL